MSGSLTGVDISKCFQVLNLVGGLPRLADCTAALTVDLRMTTLTRLLHVIC